MASEVQAFTPQEGTEIPSRALLKPSLLVALRHPHPLNQMEVVLRGLGVSPDTRGLLHRFPRGQDQGASGSSNPHPPGLASTEAASALSTRQARVDRPRDEGAMSKMRPGLRRSSWTSPGNWEKRPELLPDWTQGKTDAEVLVCTQTGEPILGSRGLAF